MRTHRPPRSGCAKHCEPLTMPSRTTSRTRALEKLLETCHNVKRLKAQEDLGHLLSLMGIAIVRDIPEQPFPIEPEHLWIADRRRDLAGIVVDYDLVASIVFGLKKGEISPSESRAARTLRRSTAVVTCQRKGSR